MKSLNNGHWVNTKGLTSEQFNVLVLIAHEQDFERSEIFEDDYQTCIAHHALILMSGQLCIANKADIQGRENEKLTLDQWFFSNSNEDITHFALHKESQTVKRLLLVEETDSHLIGVRHKHWLDDDTKRCRYKKPHWVLVSPVTDEYTYQCAVKHLLNLGFDEDDARFAVLSLQKAGFLKHFG